MKRRRSILLDEELDRRVERHARQRGLSYTDVVREALQEHFCEPEQNPNQWLLDLADEIRRIGQRAGFPDAARFPIDSDGARDHAAREIYRHKLNREPPDP